MGMLADLKRVFPDLNDDTFASVYGTGFIKAYRKIREDLGAYLGMGEVTVNNMGPSAVLANISGIDTGYEPRRMPTLVFEKGQVMQHFATCCEAACDYRWVALIDKDAKVIEDPHVKDVGPVIKEECYFDDFCISV